MNRAGLTILKGITLDRALLVAVLTIQAGMAGWFYKYYTTQQQRQRTHNQDPSALTSAPLRPAPPLAQTFPLQTSYNRSQQSIQNLPMLDHMLRLAEKQQTAMPSPSFMQFDQHNLQAEAMMHKMRQRMQRSMQAIQRMHNSTMTADAWQGAHMSPAMDMREFDDHYELQFSIPGMNLGDVKTTLEGRLLSVGVENTAPPHPTKKQRQSFQSRIMLPWQISSNATLQTHFDKGTLTINITKTNAHHIN